MDLLRAVEKGDVEGVRQLMKGEGTVNFADTLNNVCITPLCMASKKGHTEVVRLLLEHGADIHGWTKPTHRLYPFGQCRNRVVDCTSTPLYCASQGGHTEVVKLLLVNGADVNRNNKDDSKTPLHIASQGGHSKTVKVLLDRGANVNEMKCGQTPLHIASSEGHTEVVELLLNHGADVNIAETRSGRTPLYVASDRGHTEVVKLLLDHGPDVNIAETGNGQRNTPLHGACRGGCADVVKILLEHGATANITNEDGWTPFHSAVGSDRLKNRAADMVKIIQMLLDHGADINAQTKLDDVTPLHIVSTGKNLGSKEVARVLLEKGADVNMMNAHGKTALNIAEDNRSIVTKLLLLHQQKQVEDLKIQQMEAASSHAHQNPKLEERPTLQQFQCLKWVDEKGTKRQIHIMRNISSDWRQLGISLGFNSAELDTVEAGRSDNVLACTERLFGLWEKKGEKFSWKGLIEALKDADLVNLAGDLEKALLHDQTTKEEQ